MVPLICAANGDGAVTPDPATVARHTVKLGDAEGSPPGVGVEYALLTSASPHGVGAWDGVAGVEVVTSFWAASTAVWTAVTMMPVVRELAPDADASVGVSKRSSTRIATCSREAGAPEGEGLPGESDLVSDWGVVGVGVRVGDGDSGLVRVGVWGWVVGGVPVGGPREAVSRRMGLVLEAEAERDTVFCTGGRGRYGKGVSRRCGCKTR